MSTEVKIENHYWAEWIIEIVQMVFDVKLTCI